VTASAEILIGDAGGQHVLIRPLARSQPGLFDYRDANWIACEVDITAGGFRGKLSADLRSEEFQGLLEDVEALSRSLEGSATFATMEGQITLSLTTDGQGLVRVNGDALDAAGTGNRLRFGFQIDQADLPQLCRDLESLLIAFPVIGHPMSDISPDEVAD
jgi:hypothetical protein